MRSNISENMDFDNSDIRFLFRQSTISTTEKTENARKLHIFVLQRYIQRNGEIVRMIINQQKLKGEFYEYD